MNERCLSDIQMQQFSGYLLREEKSDATYGKYLRDVRNFVRFAGSRPVSKELVMAWKRELMGRGYAVRSINSMLASVNSFLRCMGWQECMVKNVRIQQQTYCSEEKELTRAEYLRLLAAADKNERLKLVLQTICATGIRVSELRHFTVDAVSRGEIVVDCKGKTRTILIPGKLRKLLVRYAKQHNILTGAVFLGNNGKPMDRSSIWRQMKRLCKAANVKASKVFPHNLRKLFARAFYSIEKDIAKLADILGHSSINTTRIYLVTTGSEHRRKLDRLGLVI